MESKFREPCGPRRTWTGVHGVDCFLHVRQAANSSSASTKARAPPAAATGMVTALLPSLASDAGGGDASSTTLMVGALSTGMPSWAEAAAAVPRLEESVVCTAAAVVEAGTAMVAMMSTLAAATRMETNRTSTPAASAMARCKLERCQRIHSRHPGRSE